MFAIKCLIISLLITSIACNAGLELASVPSIGVPSTSFWNSKNDNKGCAYNSKGICTGVCLMTLKSCVEIRNFNQLVCGCLTCTFNSTTKRCGGQCHNTVLQSCVSKVAQPKKASDCVCASCQAFLAPPPPILRGFQTTVMTTTVNYYENPADGNIGGLKPTCDSSTCYNNECTPVFINKNGRRVNDTLYCRCGPM